MCQASRVRAYVQRRGSWGATRNSERAFGYPSPLRGPTDELYDRLAELESIVAERDERLAALELRVADLETRR